MCRLMNFHLLVTLSLSKKEEKHKTIKHLKNIFPIHLYNRNKLNQSTSEWQDGAAVASSVENESDRSNAGFEDTLQNSYLRSYTYSPLRRRCQFETERRTDVS